MCIRDSVYAAYELLVKFKPASDGDKGGDGAVAPAAENPPADKDDAG